MITMDDEYRLEDFGFKAYLDHGHESTPEIKRITMPIPGMLGQWNFGSEIGARQFNIPLQLLEGDRLMLQRKHNEFIAFLFDEFGKPRQFKLEFDYDPGKYYMVELSKSITPSRAVAILLDIGLPLVADDPYKYSNELSEDVTWGSETITFEYNYLLGHEGLGGAVEVTSPQTIDIDVEGLAVQPVFEISGTANSLKISANGYSFIVPNFTDTDWVIDFEKYLVYKNGKETMIEIRKFFLLPGRNEIKIEGINIDIDLRIKFRDKFN